MMVIRVLDLLLENPAEPQTTSQAARNCSGNGKTPAKSGPSARRLSPPLRRSLLN